MLLSLVKNGFQKVRPSHLLGPSAESFGNADSLSVVIPLVPALLGKVTQPIGGNPTQCTRVTASLLQEGLARDELDLIRQ